MAVNSSDTVTITCDSTGELSALSADESVATASLTGKKLKITGVDEGTTDITISGAGDTNHRAPTPVVCHVSVGYALAYDEELNNNTWEKIKEAIQTNYAANLWAVGDMKADTVDGTVGILNINETDYFKLMDFNHNATVMSGGQPNALFKYPYNQAGKQLTYCDSKYNTTITQGQIGFCMNPEYYIDNIQYSNKGGWENCFSNKSLMDQFFSALSTELQAVIGNSTIYTDNVGNGTGNVASNVTPTNNKIFYLSEFGVYGTITYANTSEASFQRQVQAYANGMDKVHYRHDDQNTTAYVLLRSPYAANATNFVLVFMNGSVSYAGARFGKGAAPAFAIF